MGIMVHMNVSSRSLRRRKSKSSHFRGN